jgi:hypothetical protein
MGCEEVHTRGAASVLDGAALAPNSSEGCMHRRWTRRHVLAGIAGSAAAATAWRPASAESAGDTFKGPGMAMHGEPKYKPPGDEVEIVIAAEFTRPPAAQ